MGCLLVLAVCIVFSVSSAFAQAEQPVQTGFAAVNPVIGSGAGLMVFGRVGYRNGDLVQSSIWAGSVTTSTVLVVSSDSSSGQNTGIAIANPSNFTANITLTDATSWFKPSSVVVLRYRIHLESRNLAQGHQR